LKAYYSDTGCSLATGLVYGGTWDKGVLYGGKALNYDCKALKTAFQSTKSVAQNIKAAKLAVTHTPATKLFQKVHIVGASAVKEALVLGRRVENATDVLICSKNIVYTNSNGYFAKSGWELVNTNYQSLRNSSSKLNNYNYTGYAFDQMQNRGIMPSVVENTIKIGSIFSTRPGSIGFFDPINKIRVITDTNVENIITVIRGGV